MKKEELLKIFPEMTDEQAEAVFALNGRDIEKHKKAAADAKADADTLAKQLSERDKDIEALKASEAGAESLQTKLTQLQQKYDTDTETYRTQLAQRDYMDAVNQTIAEKNIQFSSNAAKKAYIAELKEKQLELKDGRLSGFDDFHKAQMETDPEAFAGDKPAPSFVHPVGVGAAPAAESKFALFAKQYGEKVSPAQNQE